MKKIVFACIQNAGRSQMAAAFFNGHADPRLVSAVSAGTRPARSVHPEVVEILREKGIDLTGVVPRLLTPELAEGAELLITLGCGEFCEGLQGVPRVDWPIRDPHGRTKEEVRAIRDELEVRVLQLLDTHGWRRARTRQTR